MRAIENDERLVINDAAQMVKGELRQKRKLNKYIKSEI